MMESRVSKVVQAACLSVAAMAAFVAWYSLVGFDAGLVGAA